MELAQRIAGERQAMECHLCQPVPQARIADPGILGDLAGVVPSRASCTAHCRNSGDVLRA
jgi:hypothetical protein